MKKVFLTVKNMQGEKAAHAVSGALNDLSGVVAAHAVPEANKAYAYAGDALAKEVMVSAVQKAGYEATAVNEEYLNDWNDLRNNL